MREQFPYCVQTRVEVVNTSVMLTALTYKFNQRVIGDTHKYFQVGNISMLNEDVHDFIALVEGYYRLYVNPNRTLLRESKHTQNNNTDPTGTSLCPTTCVASVIAFVENNI